MEGMNKKQKTGEDFKRAAQYCKYIQKRARSLIYLERSSFGLQQRWQQQQWHKETMLMTLMEKIYRPLMRVDEPKGGGQGWRAKRWRKSKELTIGESIETKSSRWKLQQQHQQPKKKKIAWKYPWRTSIHSSIHADIYLFNSTLAEQIVSRKGTVLKFIPNFELRKTYAEKLKNGFRPNGIRPNGIPPNFLCSNGVHPKGIRPNGVLPKGIHGQGQDFQGGLKLPFFLQTQYTK